MFYQVGQKYKEFVGQEDNIKFDINDSGSILRIIYNKPLDKEIQQVKQGKFELRKTVMRDIIFLTIKFEELPWMDTPYTPHLSPNLSAIPDISDNNLGLNLIIYLIDSSDGEIKAMWLIGMTHKFSKALFKNVKRYWGKVLTMPISNQTLP